LWVVKYFFGDLDLWLSGDLDIWFSNDSDLWLSGDLDLWHWRVAAMGLRRSESRGVCGAE
jgi:hypothetical protein